MNFTGARFILGLIPLFASSMLMGSLLTSVAGSYKRAFAMISGFGMLIFALGAGSCLIFAENIYMRKLEMHICFGSFIKALPEE